MIVTLFRSKLTSDAGADYAAMAQEMIERAKTYPGFVAVKGFKADDGERLTVVWWESEELQAAWARDERHREAQRRGRSTWYEYYDIEVAQIVRARRFRRSEGKTSSVREHEAFPAEHRGAGD